MMAVASLLAAAVVAVVSRAPASVRSASASPQDYDPERGATFSERDVDRHRAYRHPAYLSFALVTGLQLLLLVLLMRGPFGILVDRLRSVPGGWPARAALGAVAIAALAFLIVLPIGFVRGYVNARAWGLSTQNFGGWATDQLKGLAIASTIAAITAMAFFGVVRAAPRTWWLWGWAAFTALSVVLVFLYPVAIAPLFNRFTSLEEGPLRDRILALGTEADVPLDDVLVADAARRTTAENAYVAGIGATNQMVLFDTLLTPDRDEDEIVLIAAHELGHKAEGHIAKNLALTSLGLLAGFGLLWLLTARGTLLSAAGASLIADLRVLPALLLFVTVLSLLALPVQNAVSRAFEREADRFALELTEAPDAAVSAFRRLAFSNIADLSPPRLAVWVLFTHPPIVERIESFRRP